MIQAPSIITTKTNITSPKTSSQCSHRLSKLKPNSEYLTVNTQTTTTD